MSDQGLSIFDDDEPDEEQTQATDADATQVMPAVPPRQAPAAAPAAPEPAAAEPPAPVLPPRAQQTAPTAIPVVRRGGYDRDAVDAKLRQLTTEKAGLSGSLSQSERRVLELEEQLSHLSAELAENKNPSYAG